MDINQERLNPEPNNYRKDLSNVLKGYLTNWKVYVICVVVLMSAAAAYVVMTIPTYEINASIIVKDEKKGPIEKATLEELYQVNSPKISENEIEILKSKYLMDQVIDELSLWKSITVKKGFFYKPVYKDAPVDIQYLERFSDYEGVVLEVKIKDEKSFLLKNKDGEFDEFPFGTVLHNETGEFKIVPTSYVKSNLGSTLKISVPNPDKLTKDFRARFEASLVNKQSPVIGLIFKDNIPARGKDVLNKILDLYNNSSLKEKAKTTQSTLNFIDERLSSLTDELNTSEKEVEGFRSSRGLTDINAESKMYLENVQANDSKLNEVNIKLNIVDEIERYINSPINSQNPPASLGISDASLSSSIEQLFQLNLQREKLLATTPETNPVFDGIDRQISTTKAAVKQNIKNIKSSLLAAKEKLVAYNSKIESSIKNIPSQERQYVSIKRQQSIKENLYLYLLQKKEEISLSYASTVSDAKVIDRAYVNSVVWPKKMVLLAAAFIFAIIIASTISFYRNYYNREITSVAEIESELPISIAGELKYEKLKHPLIIKTGGSFVLGEQFRALRANLKYLNNDMGTNRVILVTSSVSNEGKSFVASNLALSLAAAGRKVALIDLDLRKSRISQIFEATVSKGISDYLANPGTSFREMVMQDETYPNLDIIGNVNNPPNPSELLVGSGLERLIDEMRTEYDDIILDTPPVQIVADSLILSRLADFSLYVLRPGVSKKSDFKFVRTLYKQEKLGKLSLVVNGLKLSSSQEHRYYQYDNGYRR
jgi:capsular exopolysaccharide synthesis family protein